MISFSIKYKIIFRIMSKVTQYTVGFGEETATTFEVPIFLVKVYVAPSNKEKQLYQQCFAIIWIEAHLGNKIHSNFQKKWSINPGNIHNL